VQNIAIDPKTELSPITTARIFNRRASAAGSSLHSPGPARMCPRVGDRADLRLRDVDPHGDTIAPLDRAALPGSIVALASSSLARLLVLAGPSTLLGRPTLEARHEIGSPSSHELPLVDRRRRGSTVGRDPENSRAFGPLRTV